MGREGAPFEPRTVTLDRPGVKIDQMSRTVFCAKLKKDLPGLDEAPWPGELGKRVYENISAQAWKMWEDRMKMILNEYRLMPWQKEAQELMARQMEEFLFGESSTLPPGYVPQSK